MSVKSNNKDLQIEFYMSLILKFIFLFHFDCTLHNSIGN